MNLNTCEIHTIIQTEDFKFLMRHVPEKYKNGKIGKKSGLSLAIHTVCEIARKKQEIFCPALMQFNIENDLKKIKNDIGNNISNKEN